MFLLHGPGYQAAGRFLIISYFYGFLILMSVQVDGTYSVAHRQVADSRRANGCAYRCAHVCIILYMNRLAVNNQQADAGQTTWHSGR